MTMMIFRALSLAALAASAASASSTIAGTSSSITWQGRTVARSTGAVSFDWEGVQAMFIVEGSTSVTVTINSTFLSSAPETRGDEVSSTSHPSSRLGRSLQQSSYPKFGVYRVFVDGQRANTTINAFPGLTSDAVVASGLDPTVPHTINLYYSTDPVFNTWPNLDCIAADGYACSQSIVSFSTDGSFSSTPPPQKSRRLLIIGDSITAGNAVYRPLCSNSSGDDLSVSYGNLLCQRFDANCTTLAVSSKGLYQNCCDSLPTTMKDFILRRFAQDTRGGANLFDWNEFIPDAVLVNLGTNDSGHDSGPAWEEAFTSLYVQLLTNLTRWANDPSIPIFAGAGPITEKYAPWVQNALKIASTQYGVNGTFVDYSGAPLDGCGHPGVAGHQRMFQIAEPIVAQVMGWS